MAKFLTVSTASHGKLLIPQEKFIIVLKSTNTQSRITYESSNANNQIIITHNTDSGNVVSTFIQDKMIELAQSSWKDSVIDITDSCPIEITNLTIS